MRIIRNSTLCLHLDVGVFDNALSFVVGSVLGPEMLTSKYQINYLRPVIGEKLVARANVIYSEKRQSVCRCDVFSQDTEGKEKLCATSQGTIVTMT